MSAGSGIRLVTVHVDRFKECGQHLISTSSLDSTNVVEVDHLAVLCFFQCSRRGCVSQTYPRSQRRCCVRCANPTGRHQGKGLLVKCSATRSYQQRGRVLHGDWSRYQCCGGGMSCCGSCGESSCLQLCSVLEVTNSRSSWITLRSSLFLTFSNFLTTRRSVSQAAAPLHSTPKPKPTVCPCLQSAKLRCDTTLTPLTNQQKEPPTRPAC